MPFCFAPQLKLTLSIALLINILGARITLHAEQINTSSSTSSSNQPTTVPQPPSAPELPDDPSALLGLPSGQTPASTPVQQLASDPDAVSANGTQQTKRILGIVPNFRSVSADTKLPPMSPNEKFIIAGKDTFDYSSFLIAGVQAGFAMNSNSYPEFHQGLKGYGRYYWHTLADTADENFMVGGLGPMLFKQDNRFYTLGHGGFRKRSVYAVTRVLISRKDDGDRTFNFAEIIGSGAAAGASTLYYPTKYRTWTKVGQKWLTSDLIDSFNFFYKEFWPDVNKKIFHTH